MRSGSRRSPGEVYLQLKSGVKSASRRSLDEVFLQPESGMKSGSRRSLGEVYLQSWGQSPTPVGVRTKSTCN